MAILHETANPQENSVLQRWQRWCKKMSLLLETPLPVADEAAQRRRLAATLEAMKGKISTLEQPLWVLIVGGTGVGKSTFINALAGNAISLASPVRPTTQILCAYVHEKDIESIPANWDLETIQHNRSKLRRKVIIDTPDYDSVLVSNRQKLLSYLPLVDIVLWISTAEKYADQVAYEVLRPFAREKSFLFLLNKIDLELSPDTLKDWRSILTNNGFSDPEIYPVATENSFLLKQGRTDRQVAENHFGELERRLEEEITSKQIRAIKAQNILSSAQHLVGDWQALLPTGETALRKELNDRLAEVTQQMADEVWDRLIHHRRFGNHLLYRLATSQPGIVGALLTVTFGPRALFRSDYPSIFDVHKDPLKTAVGDLLQGDAFRRLHLHTDALRADLLDKGARAGWYFPPGGEENMHLPDLLEALQNQFHAHLEEWEDPDGKHSGPFWARRASMITWSVFGLVVAAGVYLLLFENMPISPVETLDGGGIAVVLTMILTYRLTVRSLRRSVSELQSSARQYLKNALSSWLRLSLLAPIEESLTKVEKVKRQAFDLQLALQKLFED